MAQAPQVIALIPAIARRANPARRRGIPCCPLRYGQKLSPPT